MSHTDIDKAPRFKRVKVHKGGALDKKRLPRMCDNHPQTPAIYVGEVRPISRIMFYPFALCGGCFGDLRASRGQITTPNTPV